MQLAEAPWAVKAAWIDLVLLVFQTLTTSSSPPAATQQPLEEMATDIIEQGFPSYLKLSRYRPVNALPVDATPLDEFQRKTVPSRLHDTIRSPLDENATLRTAAMCPFRV
jgi:hypothetical protein